MKPRQTVHRGVVLAGALLFDEQLLGAAKARARALALFTPGTVAVRFGSLLLLRFQRPRLVDCASAPGLPLVEQGALLAAMPLEPDERARLLHASIVWTRAGVAEELTNGVREDPASWVDVSAFELTKVASLGSDPPPVPQAIPEAVAVDREKLGAPAADPGAAKLSAALASADKAAAGATAKAVAAKVGAVPVMAAGLAAFGLLRAAKWLVSNLFPFLTKPAKAGTPGPDVTPLQAAARPGFWSRLNDKLDALLARAAILTRFSRLLSGRQLNYLRKLFESLEGDDLDETLRTAIPLADPGASGSGVPALGVPSARADLSITMAPQRSGTSYAFGEGLYQELRRRYRALFERLEREGLVEKAAFVLAELLRDSSGAVDYLERNGRLRLAAELAEARGLSPDRVVRQWVLAGDEERAISIARLHGVFAAAAGWLEKTNHKDAAMRLRLHWADAAASAGNFLEAADAIAKIESAKSLMCGFLERLVERGGYEGAIAMVRQLDLDDESFPLLVPKALRLLEDDSIETADERTAMATVLARAGVLRPRLAELANEAVRAMLRDSAAGHGVERSVFVRLTSAASDRALSTDLPQFQRVTARPEKIVVAAGDCGTRPIYDAALAPRRRVLVALGEAGARLLSPDGRTVREFSAPAHRLIVSDHGDRALALAPRGGVYRVTQLDLASGKSRHWGELRLQAFAPDYDGSIWFVAMDGALVALDATADSPRSLWRVGEVGWISRIARSPTSLSLAVVSAGTFERWRYALPGLQLRERKQLTLWDGGFSQIYLGSLGEAGFGADADGRIVFTAIPPEESSDLTGHQAVHEHGGLLASALEGCIWAVALSLGDRCAVETRQVARSSFNLSGKTVFELVGTSGAALRMQRLEGKLCLVCSDDRGRVLAIDASSGEQLANLRQ